MTATEVNGEEQEEKKHRKNRPHHGQSTDVMRKRAEKKHLKLYYNECRHWIFAPHTHRHAQQPKKGSQSDKAKEEA